ncbi:MAG: hypothetical protein KFB95_05200 [Simkaniaceae bacterium]|nr:MAG: hypothetical protein KFB95_05200 [Simkaniaceae bacterium]
MKKLLIFLLPFALWADYLFVLHDVGETVALMPVIEELQGRGETVEVIRLDPTDRYASIEVSCAVPDVLVVGDASIGQLQYVRAFKGKAKTVCYYDNVLEIDRIPYADLIREFEKEADLFLVPSALAAKSSHVKAHVVGNPDLDRFENEVGEFEVIPGRVVYFGGYDKDYEEAFKAFLKLYPDAIVYPHPKTDGMLERCYGARIGEGSSLQAVGEAETVVIHRSSIGVKAALVGKTVYSMESDGSFRKITATRASLNVPRDSASLICDFLL